MTTPNTSPAVEITYDTNAKLFDITVDGIEVDKTPLSIIKELDRRVNEDNAATYGHKTLAHQFAAAYRDVDVKKLHQTALEPVNKLNDLLVNRIATDTDSLRKEFREAFINFRRTLNEINQGVYARLRQPEPPATETPRHELIN